jgi:dTDP-glucose 4,6-dehydratase
MLCTVYGHQRSVHTTIARCFSFIGPGLPLDANYAIGNFIRDALVGRQVLIKGSGREKRSYLYTSDLIIWLLTLLVRGEKSSVVNVGSDKAYSISEVADTVSRVLDGKGVDQSEEARRARVRDDYVPSVEVAYDQYGLRQTVSLGDGVRRTAICMGWKAPFSN